MLKCAKIDSNIPQGSGLGSSAALSVALGRAILGPANQTDLFNLAKCFDDKFHEGSSGLDVFTSIHGGLVKLQQGTFEKMSVDLLKRLKEKFKFSIINTKHSRRVKEVKSQMDKDFYPEFLKEAEKISNTFTDKLLTDTLNLTDMINLFARYQGLLKKLKVSTDFIDEIVSRLTKCPLIGVKITGGGGGGCLLLVHEESVSESVIMEALDGLKEDIELYYNIEFSE